MEICCTCLLWLAVTFWRENLPDAFIVSAIVSKVRWNTLSEVSIHEQRLKPISEYIDMICRNKFYVPDI